MLYERQPWRDRVERALDELKEASIVLRLRARRLAPPTIDGDRAVADAAIGKTAP